MSFPVPAAMMARTVSVPAQRLTPRSTVPSPPVTARTSNPEAIPARARSRAEAAVSSERSTTSWPSASSRAITSTPIAVPRPLSDVGLMINPMRLVTTERWIGLASSQRASFVVGDFGPFGLTARTPPVQQGRDTNGRIEEPDHRQGESKHGPGVGGRGHHRRENEDEHDGNPPAFEHDAGRQDMGHVEPDEEHRQQERQAEGQDEPGHEGQVERRIGQVGRSLRSEAEEYLDRPGGRIGGEETSQQKQGHGSPDERY